jgi:2'-5' RNA ligase
MQDRPLNVRLFVALPVPAEVKAVLGRVRSELPATVSPQVLAWTRPENLHLTLRFLGDVDATRVTELQQHLLESLAGMGELDLRCERLGCFPDLRFPRVVWAWVHDVAEQLPVLARRVDEVVAPFADRPAEGRFTGHITLARCKRISRREAEPLARFIERQVARCFGEWRAKELELIRSELTPSGSRYTTLARVLLGDGKNAA